MGLHFSQYQNPRGIAPQPSESPSFDPLFGFPEGRKERKMIATEVEMSSAKIPLANRDYCAHMDIAWRACRNDNFPMLYRCEHAKHNLLNCMHADYVLRMKEYERERRLRLREQRISSGTLVN